MGSPYYAVADGVVIWASDRKRSRPNELTALGWHVRIAHRDGYETWYAHAQPNPPVRVGDVVKAGQVIARSGNTGNSSGAHLHLTLYNTRFRTPQFWNGWLDPTPFIDEFLHGIEFGLFADLSHHNGTAHDWDGYFGRFPALVAKATENIHFVSDALPAFHQAAREADAEFTVYHFLRPQNAIQQAQHLYETVKDLRLTWRVWLDVERHVHLNEVADFMLWWERKTGYRPIIYTRTELWEGLTGNHAMFADDDFVIAEYNDVGFTAPRYGRVVAWQFTEHGRLPSLYSTNADGRHDICKIVNLLAMRIPDFPPAKIVYDLWHAMTQAPQKAYMVANDDGNKERYQNFVTDNGMTLYKTKNGNWEMYQLDTVMIDGQLTDVIRLVRDTSPEDHGDIDCHYEVVGADGKPGGIWAKRWMAVGETFVEPEPHQVNFYASATGRDYDDPRSGVNRNVCHLFAADALGNLHFGNPDGEQHITTDGYGVTGWIADWGGAELSSDDAGEWVNRPKTITLGNGQRFTPSV